MSKKKSEYESKLDTADRFLTKFKIFLKKHWIILTLILIGYCGYKFCGLVWEDVKIEEQQKINNIKQLNTYQDSSNYQDTTDQDSL